MDSSTSFGSLPDGTSELAVVDDYQYLAVRWVMRRQAGEQLDYYAPLHAWTTTPAGQLGVRDQAIAELRRRVAELEAILAGRDAEALAAPEPTTDHRPTPPAAVERKLPAGRVQCPHCKRAPWANKLADHLSEAHPEQLALAEPTEASTPDPASFLPVTPIGAVLDDLAWRCKRCEMTIFTQSVAQPDLCVRCAATTPPSTNGHLVSA